MTNQTPTESTLNTVALALKLITRTLMNSDSCKILDKNEAINLIKAASKHLLKRCETQNDENFNKSIRFSILDADQLIDAVKSCNLHHKDEFKIATTEIKRLKRKCPKIAIIIVYISKPVTLKSNLSQDAENKCAAFLTNHSTILEIINHKQSNT